MSAVETTPHAPAHETTRSRLIRAWLIGSLTGGVLGAVIVAGRTLRAASGRLWLSADPAGFASMAATSTVVYAVVAAVILPIAYLAWRPLTRTRGHNAAFAAVLGGALAVFVQLVQIAAFAGRSLNSEWRVSTPSLVGHAIEGAIVAYVAWRVAYGAPKRP